MKTTQTALITGASRGIGRSLAQLHALAGHDLVLVARNETQLQELADQLQANHQIATTIIPADLTDAQQVEQVFTTCQDQHIDIDYLINNAGFGGYGRFDQRDRTDDQAMIALNINALTHLTHLFLPGMIKRKRGKIMQVASTAGMVPGPMQAVYHATKAYVLSLSQALAAELAEIPITVTALCPGPVDTDFAKEANLEDTSVFADAAPVDQVAQDGFEGMMRGKLVVITGLPTYYRLLLGLLPLLPRKFVLKQARQAVSKKSEQN